MTNRTLLLCVCLLVVLAGLATWMRALFPERIDLPFDTGSTIMAAEFAQTPEEFSAVIGSDRRYAGALKTQQYLDFPFIAGYVALFVLLGLTLKTYDVPGARWLAWAAIVAAVVAGICDILENITILQALSSSAVMLQTRRYSIPKWGFAFLAVFIEAGVFFFWPRLGLWWRLGAAAAGFLWLVTGSSGVLFAALASVTDIPWSASWMTWGLTAALLFMGAILVRDRLRKA